MINFLKQIGKKKNEIFFLSKPRITRSYWSIFNINEKEYDLDLLPHKKLFSSLIEYETPNETQINLIKESNLCLNGTDSLKKNKLTEKIRDFQLTRKDYNDFMEKNPNGRVNIFNYNDTKITLVGAQYEFLPIKNLYQILNYSKPDILLLQIKPDQILKKLKIFVTKEGSKKIFSNTRYFSQCLRKPEEIMPSPEYRSKIIKTLEENKIYLSKEPKSSENQYKPYEILDRISMDAIATACLFCEINKIPLVLCDIPELAYRQHFTNTKTLMQLQNIFTKCSRELALYPDLQPQTPLNLGYYVYPELFLEKSDKYIATLIEFLIHPKAFKGKHILGLVGYVQSDSIPAYLNNRISSNFDEDLTSPPPQGSFIREITSEEILEKHAIMDVLHYGKDILDKYEDLDFTTSYKIIEKYADPSKVNSNKTKELKILHYEFVKKYQHFCEMEFEEGKKVLRREFLKKTRII